MSLKCPERPECPFWKHTNISGGFCEGHRYFPDGPGDECPIPRSQSDTATIDGLREQVKSATKETERAYMQEASTRMQYSRLIEEAKRLNLDRANEAEEKLKTEVKKREEQTKECSRAMERLADAEEVIKELKRKIKRFKPEPKINHRFRQLPLIKQLELMWNFGLLEARDLPSDLADLAFGRAEAKSEASAKRFRDAIESTYRDMTEAK